MAITDRTRKSLWAKSGNRCAICKIELFSDKQETNIGQECHIISSKTHGPRHKPNIEDYDLFDNLILLCCNHHHEIDELSDTYTEELLRYVKLNHENWVQSTIDKAINSDKKTRPKFLTRVTSGKELLNIISNTLGYRTDYDEVDNEEDAKYIGGVLQELVDYSEISGMVEVGEKVQMGHELKKLLDDLDEKGYYLFGERNVERIKYANGETDKWSIMTIVIKKKDSSEIIKLDLNEIGKNTNT